MTVSTSSPRSFIHSYSKWTTKIPAVLCLLIVGLITVLLARVPLPSKTAGKTDASATSGQQAKVLAEYGKLPIRFEANEGQTDSSVKFIARGSGYDLFLTPDEAGGQDDRIAEPE